MMCEVMCGCEVVMMHGFEVLVMCGCEVVMMCGCRRGSHQITIDVNNTSVLPIWSYIGYMMRYVMTGAMS